MADDDDTPRSTETIVVEAQEAIERERRRNVFAVTLAALTVVFAAGFVAISIFLVINVQHQLRRQDCVARIDAAFFGHLTDAIGVPLSPSTRQMFLDEMKADAAKFAHLDNVCPT